MKVFYSPAYTGAAEAYDTVRKAAWIVESLANDPIPGVTVVAPPAATADDLEEVHDAAYVASVRSGSPRHLAQSQGLAWDPGLWASVCASTGGTMAAALAALEDGVAGSLSSGLHHARRSQGRGFCTFNGIALAARRVAQAGAGPVLVLDLDAHCGGGTASLIPAESPIAQLDVAVDGFDAYTPHAAHGTLHMVRSADAYLETIARGLADQMARSRPALVLYNAGMDPFEGCDVGGLAGITERILAEREHMVFQWAAERGVPIAFVLAGGYVGSRLTSADLVRLHRHTLHAAVGCQREASDRRPSAAP